MKVAAVANPASQSGRAAKIISLLQGEALGSDGLTTVLTEYAGHATDLTRELATRGYQRVIAVGGDGTLNEVINGAAGTGIEVALIPTGTGNDWARTVGIPADVTEATKIALTGQARAVDLGTCEGKRHFINIAGAGFDAEVARAIQGAGGLMASLPPTPRYISAVLKTFARYKGANVKLRLDDKSVEIEDLTLIAIANAKFYGSGMQIAPGASLDDGLFDVVWGSGVKKSELPGLLKSVFKGDHVQHPKVEVRKASRVKIESESSVPFHLDGDVAGELPAEFSIQPRALNFLFPA